MRLEIISEERTDVIELPPETDQIGINLVQSANPFYNVSVDADFPDELCGAPVECCTEQIEIADGVTVQLHLYRFNGAAKALSLKGYEGLVFCDITCGDVRVILAV